MHRYRLILLILCVCAGTFAQSSFWTNTTQPATASASDTAAVTVGLKFTSTVRGKVTGVRFFKGSGNTGTHVGALWNSRGNLLSSVTFRNESSSGWQVANFSSPVAIDANTTYVVSYTAPNGRYAINTYYSWTSISATPLGVSGSSPGVYSYGSGSRFPTSSWNSSNYWVDPIFIADSGTTPVVQISLSPTSVSLSAGQTRQFTASVTGSSNTGATWTLSPQVGSISSSGLYTAPSSILSAQTVTITARSVADSTKYATATVSLTPPAPAVQISLSPTSVSLSAGQTRQFTASVTGSSNTGATWTLSPQVGSISAAGLYTAPSSILSAQTVAVTARSVADSTKYATATVSLTPTASTGDDVSFWQSQAVPSMSQASDTASVTLGVRFTSDVPGKVIGIRFYKGTDNGGTHVANLWSASGTSLGQTTFASETASGWQQTNFATPITVSANTTYVASYYAPNGKYAINQAFNWSGLNAAPLRPSGTAGVYAYGSGAKFPSSVWNSSNYWVDVVFRPDSGDQTPTPTTYTISGTVSGSQATLSLSGPSAASTTTNSTGNYTFSGLQNGLYVIVPSRTGYSFSPSTRSVTVNSASVSGINFSATATPAPRTVSLTWKSSSSSSVVGYNLYRSSSITAPYQKINGSPIGGTGYVDSNITTGATYYYLATAVDGSGMESEYSNQATAIVK